MAPGRRPCRFCGRKALPGSPYCRSCQQEVHDPDYSPSEDSDSGRWGSVGTLLAVLPLVVVLALGAVHVGPAALDAGVSYASSLGNVSDAGGGDTLQPAEAETLIHEEVNDRRADHGLSPLEYSHEVAQDANAHSVDMATRGYFSHDEPGGNGLRSRVQAPCRFVAENIAQTYWQDDVQGYGEIESESDIAQQIVSDWMDSPGHRENILEGEWRAEGIGVTIQETTDGRKRVFVTQNFC